MFVAPSRSAFAPFTETLWRDERTRAFRDRGFLPHQARVASFVAPDTPFRGLVLLHGLGTGKTSAAAAAAVAWTSGASSKAPRKVRVITPAALRAAFATELQRRGIVRNETIDLQFVSQNGLTAKTISSLKRDGNAFDDALVIVDEAHNISRTLANDETGAKDGPARALYDLVRTANRAKVLLLTATPIHNHAVEIAFLANMVNGPVVEYTARFLAPIEAEKVSSVEEALAADGRVDASLVTRADVRLRLVPDPRFRFTDPANGSMQIVPPGTPSPTVAAVLATLADTVAGAATGRPIAREHELLPTERPVFDAVFVNPNGGLVNRGILSRRLAGVVSSFERSDDDVPAQGSQAENEYPRVRRDTVSAVKMGARQITEYARAREYEQKLESKSTGGDDDLSVYRYYSRITSNFVFPTGPRGRRAFKFEDAASTAEEYAAATRRAIVQMRASRFWHDDAALESHAPKFVRVLERVSRPNAGKCVVFSAFREVEGIGLFAELLLARGWRRVTARGNDVEVRGATPDASGPCFAAPQPSDAEGQTLLALFNGHRVSDRRSSSTHNAAFDALASALRVPVEATENLRGETMRLILLSRSGAEGVNLAEVRQMHVLEPHWNAVQLQQAVGRAVRLGSHARLPADERDVSIYRYIATLPATGSSSVSETDAAIFEADRGVSTDEHVAASAMRKARVASQVLDTVRAAAVDCDVNAPPGARACYEPPARRGNLTPARIVDDDDDPLGEGRRMRVHVPGGADGERATTRTRDVVVFENSTDVFDADAYTDNGRLVVVGFVTRHGDVDWLEPGLAETERGSVALTPRRASNRHRVSASRNARTP